MNENTKIWCTPTIWAYEYYIKNTAQSDQWFFAEAKLPDLSAGAMKIAGQFEPNLEGKSIRMSFNQDDEAMLQKAADFVGKQLDRKIDMKNFVSNSYLGN